MQVADPKRPTILRKVKLLIAGVVVAGALITPAVAAEQVVMPYRCEAFGREISLTPSEPRAYDIYGRREQDMVTACAPRDPSRCRTWRLHRFEMKCGNARVPWIDVVDAANAVTGGPAKVRDGRLYVRMNPWWARQRPPQWEDRPKLREFEDGDWRPNTYRYQPTARAPSVEMPPGFAPVVGLTARFVEGPPGAGDAAQGGGSGPLADRGGTAPTAPTGSEKSAPEKPAAAKPLPAAAAPVTAAPKTSTRDPGHTFEPKTADAKPVEAPAPVPVEAPAAQSVETKTAAAAPQPPPAAASPEIAAAVPGTSVAPSLNSVAPTILNRPGAETTAITSATSSSGDKSGSELAASQAAMPATLEPGAAPPLLTPPASMARNLPLIMGLAALMLAGTALAYFMRRQNEGGFHASATPRDLSSVSLDAAHSQDQSRALVRTGPPAEAPSAASRPLPPQPTLAQPTLSQALLSKAPPFETFVTRPGSEPEWLPATREEALHVLGAGPDASDPVLKKIVDGLRMSWHPDLAKTAEDHRVRSERMTQINVAWDILSGRQAESRPQV